MEIAELFIVFGFGIVVGMTIILVLVYEPKDDDYAW